MAPRTSIPDAELDVLTSLHRLREATARDLRHALQSRRPMAHGSVLTLLGRLERRGLVRRRKGPVGKAFVYVPVGAADAVRRPLLRRLLTRLFDGNPVDLVASLFETRPPTPDEAAALRRLVAGLKKKTGPR
jgi:predicted transcriptional regulator